MFFSKNFEIFLKHDINVPRNIEYSRSFPTFLDLGEFKSFIEFLFLNV